MEFPTILSAAMVAILIGAGLLGAVIVSLRWIKTRWLQPHVASPVTLPLEREAETGVMVTQAGGQVLFVNQRARQFFGMDGQEPNLWRMAQQTQPLDTFLELCATEGMASVNIGERRVEATSLRVNQDEAGPARFVVVLKETLQLPELVNLDEHSLQALNVVSEINRAISSKLELSATLDSILEHVGRAFQYNIAEINLWEEANQLLRPVRHAGDDDYEQELAQTSPSGYKAGEGFSGWIITHRTHLLVSNIETTTQVRPKLDRGEFPMQSYLGVPLFVDQNFLGTLELVSYKANSYQPTDVMVLETIASQAAIAIKNAQSFAEQQQRVEELSGLAEITRAIESTTDPYELYSRLTDDIARLMGVQMVGFLLYDATENALVGQAPFHGVPQIVVDVYRISIPAGSAAERLWRENEYWLSNEVTNDPLVEEVGLRQLAETVGVKATVLAPIAVGGRRLGIVQVSNKLNGAPFTSQDVHLLLIFAGQTAAILENSRLVREAQTRAEQAEGLRQIAATAAGTDLNEILHMTMQQTAALLKFDLGVIALLDEARGELAPHPASIYGSTLQEAQALSLRTNDPFYVFSVTRSRQPFITNHTARDRFVSGAYPALVEHYHAGSAMGVPLVVGDRSLGEIIIASQRENAFSRTDLQLLSTVASQLASAIERSRLYVATDQDLQRRVDQLTALTRVGRELNRTLELERLLHLVYDEALHATRANCGTILLLDPNAGAQSLTLRLGEEELGQTLTPLEEEVVQTGRPKLVNDLQPDSPLAAHPDVRAAIAVPILVQDVVVGLIHLHSHASEGFDDTSVETAAALAAQAAIAVSNAQRYEDQIKRSELLRRRADQLAQLFEISRTVRSDLPLATNLEAITFGLQEAVGFNIILISVLDPQTRRLKPTASAGIPLASLQQIRQSERPWDDYLSILRDEFRISQSYFLLEETTAKLTAGLNMLAPLKVNLAAPATPDDSPNTWHLHDMLMIPLRGSGQEIVGALTLDDPRDKQRPDRSTIEIIEIFANQAALAIENARLYQSAERRVARLLALHRVIEQASRVGDRSQLWQTVAESLLAEMGLDICLIALQEDDQLVIRGQAGYILSKINLAPTLAAGTKNPLSQAITERAPLLVLDLPGSDWMLNPFLMVTTVTSFVSAPILSQGRTAGVLFVGSQHSPTPFAPEDAELFTILTNQLGASLESARLEADVSQRAGQLAALAEVSQTITSTLRTEDVVQAVLTNLKRVIPYDRVTLWLRAGERLHLAALQGLEETADLTGMQLEIADSALFAEMAETRGAILVPDALEDPRFPGSASQVTRSWLGAPLVSKGQITGVLVLDKIEPNAYSSQAAQVLVAFANQAAVALDNARLFEESEQRTRELDERSQRLARLNRVSAQLGSTLKVDRILEITLTEVANALNIDRAAIATFDENGQAILAAQTSPIVDPKALDLLKPTLARVRETLVPLAIENVAQDEILASVRPAFLARGIQSLLAIPLVAAGSPIAAIQLEETTAIRHFTPGEIEMAQTLANQAAVSIQNARLYDETQARLAELATLNQISHAISSTIDPEEVYQTIDQQVRSVLNVDTLYLALYNETRNQLSFPLFIERGKRLWLEAQTPVGLAAQVIHTREPLRLKGEPSASQSESLNARAAKATPLRSYLGVPLMIGDRVIGVLAVQDLERPNAFTYSHERILTTIAAQVAIAIENARLYTEVQERASELGQRTERLVFLNRLSATLSASLDLNAILKRAAEKVVQLFRIDHSNVIFFSDASRSGIIRAEYPELGFTGLEIPLEGEWLEGELIVRRQPVVIEAVASEKRLAADAQEILTKMGIQSTLLIPFIAQGQAIGAFTLDAISAPRRFTSDEIELCQTIAAQMAVAVTNARFAQELEARVAARTQDLDRERQRVETLLQITTELSTSLDLDRVLLRALQLVTDAIGAEHGSIFMLDMQSNQLIYRASLGRAKPLARGGEPAPFKRNEGLVGWVIKNKQPVVIPNVEEDPRWKHFSEEEEILPRSAVGVPLMANEDALGAMILLSPKINAFDEEQLRLVAAAANQVGAAINNAELYRLIRDQAERLGGMLRGQQVEATQNRSILEGIADGVLVTNAEEKIILFNVASERILGLKRNEVMGRPITEFVGIYGVAGKGLLEAISRWSQDPGSYRPGEYAAAQLELEDQRVISIHLAPVSTAEEYLGSVSVLRDITREVEVDRLKSEFVTNVSHELRTPMTSIKGYADVLLMGAAGPLTPDQGKFLDVIKSNADRLSMLVNDLLDISRIESGRVELVMRPISLNEIIREVMATLQGRMDEENKQLSIQLDLPSDLPPVWGDRERVTEVVMNLADNAYNYSHPGGTITVQAKLDEVEQIVQVEVTDTGVGVAPEDQPRLFDRFYRGEDALVLATPGTGLGLPIAKQLMEMHGGRLWLVRSELGQGTTFAFTLPLASSQEEK